MLIEKKEHYLIFSYYLIKARRANETDTAITTPPTHVPIMIDWTKTGLSLSETREIILCLLK